MNEKCRCSGAFATRSEIARARVANARQHLPALASTCQFIILNSSFLIDRRSKFCFDLNALVSFNDVAYFDVVELVDVQTAFVAFGNFLHVFLKAFEGSQLA